MPGSSCNPDERVVIRIARTEMGQGTLTGLAQLVAEELAADWGRVSTEYPTPGQNLARKRVWGNFSTGGSRGIRESQDYVRKGGAAARIMLVQAAADEWKVPAAECRAEAASSPMRQATAAPPTARWPPPRQADAARGDAQGSEGLEARRQAPRAAGHGRQDHRQADLRR